MAAELIVSAVLDNLQQILASEADLLIGVKEKLRWIETEFRIMVAYFDSVDALHYQLPERANDLVEKTRSVIRRAEDLIETYARRSSQAKTAAFYEKPVYWFGRRGLSKKLSIIKDEIIRVRQGWRTVDLENNDNRGIGSTFCTSSAAAMAKLDSALLRTVVRHWVPLLEAMEWVRDELAPLHAFLEEIDHHVPVVLGERQKIWIKELRDIFQFVDKSFQPDDDDARSMRWNSYLNTNKLCGVVSEIQGKILQLYRRYYVYGLGQILASNTNTNNSNSNGSIFPRIRMSVPIPDVSGTDINLCTVALKHLPTVATKQAQRRWMSYSSWMTPRGPIELFEAELEMMKALLKDISPNDLDERAKVWLNQVQEISVELDQLIDSHRGRGRTVVGVFYRNKIFARKIKRIGSEIHDIAARKMTYGIDSALREETFQSQLYNQLFLEEIESSLLKGSPSRRKVKLAFLGKQVELNTLAEVRKQVESARKELDLMQALLWDVKGMEKLDARLKVWVEEMDRVARLANDVVGPDTNSLFRRFRAVKRIEAIQNLILILSKWKHTYDIRDVRRADIFSHNLEEANLEINEPFLGKCTLIRRERDIIKASVMDILEIDEADRQGTAAEEDILRALSSHFRGLTESADDRISKAWNELDGKTKAWVEEMVNIYEDDSSEQWKDKTRQLSEIRVAYGIQIRQRLPPFIVRQIKEKLLLVDHDEHRFVVPILGMRDAHKQALRDLINDDDAIRHHFRYHAWVRVPEEFTSASISDIENQIMKLASSSSSASPSMQDILTHNTCLVVLDEIQTFWVWHNLYQVLKEVPSSTGSRIILITNEHTCSLSDDIFHLPIRLSQKVLPKSRENVPSYLRQCLYYFLLFPINFEVPTRRLIALWVAEGLVHSKKNGNEGSVEHVAEHHLNELINRGLVRITKKKLNGKVKACQLNDDDRGMWLEKAREARFFQDANDCITRLVDNHGTSDVGPSFIQVHSHVPNNSSSRNYRNVISFLSFNTQEGNKPGEDIGDFLNKCILAGFFLWLRVLDLERVFRPKLPKAITRLTNLRYLGLRWTYLEDLPEFVSMLLNLQVLDMKHTYITVLPKSIWRMKYLRHLYLSETYRTRFDNPPSDHHTRVNDLQTLWGAFIDENSSVEQGLSSLRNLRKLGLSCRCVSKEQLQAVARWISELEFLETLRLKSRDENGRACDLHVESLQKNSKLSTVYLLGKLITPSVVATFPENLIEVTLSGSDLKGEDDPMEHLGKLKELIVLRLLSGSVMLSEIRCSRESFPKLKVFKIWELSNLKEWEAEEGAMPCLEDLEIRSCKSLKMVPQALQHVGTLKKFSLTRMPKSFIIDSEKERPMVWSKVEKVLQVIEQQSS